MGWVFVTETGAESRWQLQSDAGSDLVQPMVLAETIFEKATEIYRVKVMGHGLPRQWSTQEPAMSRAELSVDAMLHCMAEEVEQVMIRKEHN